MIELDSHHPRRRRDGADVHGFRGVSALFVVDALRDSTAEGTRNMLP